MQKAEYRNRKEGMATGRTEEESSTGGTAVRGSREPKGRRPRRRGSHCEAKREEKGNEETEAE